MPFGGVGGGWIFGGVCCTNAQEVGVRSLKCASGVGRLYSSGI